MSQLRAKLAAAAEENGAEAEAREAAAADAAADRAALQRAPTVGVFLSFLCVFLFVICDVVNICINISIIISISININIDINININIDVHVVCPASSVGVGTGVRIFSGVAFPRSCSVILQGDLIPFRRRRGKAEGLIKRESGWEPMGRCKRRGWSHYLAADSRPLLVRSKLHTLPQGFAW